MLKNVRVATVKQRVGILYGIKKFEIMFLQLSILLNKLTYTHLQFFSLLLIASIQLSLLFRNLEINIMPKLRKLIFGACVFDPLSF